jgi:hypothetical protein
MNDATSLFSPAAGARGGPRRRAASSHRAWVLVALPLLHLPLADEIVHAPEQGAVLVRTFETTGTAELAEASFRIHDEEHGPGEVPEVTLETVERFVLRDELARVADGRVTGILRTYAELDSRMVFTEPEGDETRERESALEGETVRFDRDAGDDEWSAAGAKDELDQDLLEGLVADLSFAVFLPGATVAEDDSWDVPVSAYGLLFAPGGNLHLELEDGEPEEAEERAGITAELIDNLDGTCTATYRGTREEDGVRVAVIALAIDVETSAEIPGAEEVERTLELTRDLAGELLWHLGDGRMHALRMDGEITETVRTEGVIPMDDEELDFVRTETFAGEIAYRFTVEAR